MRRRTLLRSLGAGVTAFGAGCLGLGGEVVVGVQEGVSIPAGESWVQEIPDVSASGGAISYVVNSEDKPFDVYFFRETGFEHYDAYIKGREPAESPAGYEPFSKVAVDVGDDEQVYEAATSDDGARESLDIEGPYYFVVDHSNYRMENRVQEHARPLTAFVNLEVVEQRGL